MIYIANFFGLLALISLVISYKQDTRKKYLLTQIFVNIFYFIQYIILKAYSAGVANAVSILRTSIFFNHEKNKKPIPYYYLIIIQIAIIILGVITYKGIISLIPILIALVYAYASWQTNLKKTYLIGFICGILWVIYNLYISAYIAVVASIIEVIASILGYKKLKDKTLD